MRRDLEEYLTSLQLQFNEMQKAVAEANELIKEGKLSSEQAMNIQKYMDNVNVNYQRALYCRYLVNLPPKFIQKIQKRKLEKEAKKFAEQEADKETVVKETQENVDNIKGIVDEQQE